MKMEIISIGTKVEWESQAQGTTKKKVGTVIAVVEAGQRAERHLPYGIDIRNKAHVKFDTNVSRKKRYIVEVPRGGKSTSVDYYCPLPSSLRLVTE